MLTVILSLVIALCAFKWFIWRIHVMALMGYIQKKDIPLPTEEELEEEIRWVGRHMINDLLGQKDRR